MSRYTIVVNSCDAFSDCWTPFFTLLQAYWPNCRQPIVLNTERLNFAWPGLAVRAARVADDRSRRLTWSEALAACLDRIETDLILYAQEDYFLNAPVAAPLIDEFAEWMRRERVATVQLTWFGSDGPFQPSTHPLLWDIARRAPYRIALQAALWRRECLRSYLRLHENAWQFEKLGTLRARRDRERFCALNRDLFARGGREVFPYVKTGIIKGQWYAPAVVDLFRAHGLAVDFARRGFFRGGSRTLERARTLARIASHPLDLVRSLR
jgi:hypothetical protein